MRHLLASAGLSVAVIFVFILVPQAVSIFILRRELPTWFMWGMVATGVCVWLILAQITGVIDPVD